MRRFVPLLALALLTGCHRPAPTARTPLTPEPEGPRAVPEVRHASTLSPTSYYPLTVGSAWFYRTEDDHVEAVSVDGENDGRITVGLVHADNLEVTKQMGRHGGNVLLYATDTKTEQKALGHHDYQPPMIVMKEVPKAGDTWQQDRFGKPAPCKAGKTEAVTVPAGTFQALRVDIVADGAPMTEWYAPGVGLVKWTDSHQHSMELVSYDVK